MPAHAIEIPHERYTLDNGLHVILHQDRALPQVVINLWYDVGARDEASGRSGFAHLFEHLMFMGTERMPGSGFDDTMEASGGYNNAWTSSDATDYFSVGPSQLLDVLLWLDADRMEGLGQAMTQEKLDLQRDVVRNERRQTHEDAPYGEVWLQLYEVMWPGGHPYDGPVIGSHEDLEAATLGDVKSFFNEFYIPNNASLVVAGDFDVEETKETIQRLFGPIPAGTRPDQRAAHIEDLPQKKLVSLTDNVQIAQTNMLWHSPPGFAEGDAEHDFVASILGDGRSSRLYRRLVQPGLALEADAYQYSHRLSSIFNVSVMLAEDTTFEDVEAIVLEETQRLAEEGPTDVEMERVRNQLEVDFVRSLESLRSRASTLNRYWASHRDPDWIQKDLDRYRNVTREGVMAAARRLNDERRATIQVTPEGGEE